MGCQWFRRVVNLFCKLPVLGALVLSCLAVSAHADKVWMENGDIISGTIQGLEAGQLTLETKYAGVITVNWRHVRSLESDDPVWVGLIGEDMAERRQLRSDGNELIVVDSDGYERSFSAAWPVAEIRKEKPALSPAWEVNGKVNLGFDSDQGNDDETTFNLSGSLDINDQWNKNNFKWDVEIEDDGGTQTKEWEVGYSYSRFFTENWFVKGSADQLYDSSEDLRSRVNAGAAVGYRFRDTIKETLMVSSGLNHLWEDYQKEDNQENIALSGSVFYRRVLIDNLEYYLDTKVFYRLQSGSQWLLDSEQGLKIGLSENLSLNLTHYLDFDSIPTDGSKKTDSQIKMGVGYSW